MNKIDQILEEALLKLKISNIDDIENIRIEYLGKKGKITEMLKSLSDLSIEEKTIRCPNQYCKNETK